jgi:hypothetical protein
MLTQFFDSFGLDGDFNMQNWIGKCGGCQTKIEQYNGEDRPRINYFLSKRQQEDLPAWKDVGGESAQFEEVSPDELPF